MNSTGIVRRIDELGRIVIPKEIRRTLRITEGDPMELFFMDGGVFIKKYSPIAAVSTMVELSKSIAVSTSKVLGMSICVTDTDNVVFVQGRMKRALEEQQITEELRDILKSKSFVTLDESCVVRISEGVASYPIMFVQPIVFEGDVVGAIIAIPLEERCEIDINLTKTVLASMAGVVAVSMEGGN